MKHIQESSSFSMLSYKNTIQLALGWTIFKDHLLHTISTRFGLLTLIFLIFTPQVQANAGDEMCEALDTFQSELEESTLDLGNRIIEIKQRTTDAIDEAAEDLLRNSEIERKRINSILDETATQVDEMGNQAKRALDDVEGRSARAFSNLEHSIDDNAAEIGHRIDTIAGESITSIERGTTDFSTRLNAVATVAKVAVGPGVISDFIGSVVGTLTDGIQDETVRFKSEIHRTAGKLTDGVDDLRDEMKSHFARAQNTLDVDIHRLKRLDLGSKIDDEQVRIRKVIERVRIKADTALNTLDSLALNVQKQIGGISSYSEETLSSIDSLTSATLDDIKTNPTIAQNCSKSLAEREGIAEASSKWRLGLGILNLNFKGLNDPRDKSVDRSDPSTLMGVDADDSRLGAEAVIRYRAPNSKYYLEGGILGANGFGASEYFREGMIDIDVMRKMDFIGFKAGAGFTVPIIKDRLWFFNAGAGGIATKTTTEFTIDYKFDGNVVESMKSRSSRTSGSLYGEIGLNYIPLRGFGGGISLQGFQLGFHDPRFDEDYEDTVWAAGAYLRIGF